MSYLEAFAEKYDFLMKDVDYKGWAMYIQEVWRRFNYNVKLVLDLGCGTGSISIILAEHGYDVIGADASSDMLSAADKKARKIGQDILFLNQKMQNLELYGTVDSVISVLDSINYILEKDELFQVFSLVKNYLNTGGLFVFDVNTLYKYRHILRDNTFAEVYEDCAYIWENCYDEEKHINEYAFNLFIKRRGGLYEKHTEYHYQRAYSRKTLEGLLKKAGFSIEGVFEAYTFNVAKSNTERLLFVARG